MKTCNIIFIHGWLFDSRIWFGIDDLLKQNYNVTKIDLPGYGKNINNTQDFKNYCEGIFSKTNDNTCLITFSFGNVLTSSPLLKNHKCINKVIYINPVYNLDITAIEKLKKNLESSRNQTIKKFIFECIKGSFNSKQEYQSIIDNFSINAFPENKILLNHLDSYIELHKEYTKPKKEINIISQNDYITPNKNIDGYLLKKAPHIPFISHKKELYTVITNFLNM
tara:strand:+ start:272 stop:940 length:669 start_codon:yes stop_codon:yes gene_type:complete